jgi:hypothetical protein
VHHVFVMMNRDASTPSGAVFRGALRAGLLLGLAGLSLSFTLGETETGNRVFLWSLAALLVAICLWGVLETIMEVRRIQRRPR